MSNLSLVRIVDDNADFRESESFVLRVEGFNVVTYASAIEFLEKDDLGIPGCVVLDVRMPGMSGLELKEAMDERSIGLPVIIITGHGDMDMAVQAFRQGASDFLTKADEPTKLFAAVRKAIAKDAEARLRTEGEETARTRWASLTQREREVAVRVANGLLNKQIAFELGISEHTVKIHRASAMRKLHTSSPAEFIRTLDAAGALQEQPAES